MEIISKQSQKAMSERKKEGYLKLAKVIQWGRKYPIRFVDRFLGIQLLDNQKYVFMMSWVTPFCVWCQCRNSGKTTLGSPFIMSKSLLIPNYQAYILAGDGSQSKEMFLKIEKIAKREIASFTGLTDVFHNELVKSASNTDGFTHNPNSFEYRLFNGSKVNTLNSVVDNLRSKRSNLNFYDESGFTDSELFRATIPFTTQNSNFRLGGDVDVTLLPQQFPNQIILASSASSIDTYFFEQYKEFSKRMFLGDKRYFVADINSDIVMNVTFDGKKYPVSLLTQDTIDNAMRENPEKASREYKNIFTKEGGDNQIIKRANIIKNSKIYKPILTNEDNNSKFILAYDPARKSDNAVNTVGLLYYDDNVGYKLRLCNCVNFMDVATKKKQQMRTPEQIDLTKEMLLSYNGTGKADYENIHKILVDAGAGGAGTTIADYFMEDWIDSKGVPHKGLIDKIECNEYVSRFPNAVDKLKLVSPQKYKKEMFDALIEMISLDLIDFPIYDGKDFLIFDENIEESYEDDNKNVKKRIELKQKTHMLSQDEKMALANLDLAKEELVSIHRFDGTNGNYRYDLSPDKARKMHDDRAFTIAMLAWELKNIRRENITNKKIKKDFDISQLFQFKQPTIRKY